MPSPAKLSSFVSEIEIRELFERAMEEDGAFDDVTTRATGIHEELGTGTIRAKQDLVLAGLDVALSFFGLFDSRIRCEAIEADGARLSAGQAAATLIGSMPSLLAVERPALNLLAHLSGIATETAKYIEAVRGTNVTILDTRKTIPGLRRLEKYAVQCGGGKNHRLGLHDRVLIKDNHIVAAGGVGAAVLRAKTLGPSGRFVEVEVGDPRALEEAIDAGADRALLDNMDLAMMARCVQSAGGRIELEVSGNVGLENVRAIAETGVDFISVGRLTHSAPAADLNMKISIHS